MSIDSTSDFEEEVTDSLEPITEPFDPSKISVGREVMSIFQVIRKVEIGEIKLDPDFQRNLVWDPIRQSRLIESVLLKIPLPAFYLDALEPSRWVVVDGLQRLSTLDAFMRTRTLRLHGLEFLGKPFDGASFAELPRSSQRDLEETQLTMFIIRPETPPKVKFTIFHRLNTGGLVLTAQEIRHATFPGAAPHLLKRLAGSPAFLKATASSVSSKRMDDRECVLRHLAFRLTSYKDYTRPDLNDFLGSAMAQLNSASEERIGELERGFYSSMQVCHALFGRYAFRKFSRAGGYRGPINKALFESWSTAVLDYDPQLVQARKEDLLSALEKALTYNTAYIQSLSLATGGIRAVRKRFEEAHNIIRSVLT